MGIKTPSSLGRRKRNTIHRIKTEGVWVYEEDDIAGVFKDYFKKIFTASDNLCIDRDVEAVEPNVTQDMRVVIAKPFTNEEIFSALSQIHPTKSLVLDGIPTIFYQKHWSTIQGVAERDGTLHGAHICRGAPPVSHLFFADDSIIFNRETEGELEGMVDVIRCYENASGQSISMEKSEVSFSKGVEEIRRSAMAGLLGVKVVDHMGFILGCPL
ncbi:hypothetical protein OROHE_009747 [Orobanche hederae]